MSLKEFYDMHPAEFWEALHAYSKEIDAERRHIGELVRGATARLININLKRCDQIKDVAEWWPMPWDDDKEAMEQEVIERLRSLSEEEKQSEAKAFLESIGHHG